MFQTKSHVYVQYGVGDRERSQLIFNSLFHPSLPVRDVEWDQKHSFCTRHRQQPTDLAVRLFITSAKVAIHDKKTLRQIEIETTEERD